MNDGNRTKEDLIKELLSLRRTVARLEKERQDRSAVDSFLGGILDSLDDPVFVKDEHHRWVTLNDAACRLLDRTREEVIGKTDQELLPERDAAAIAEQDEEVLNTGMSVFHTDRFGPKKNERVLATKKSLFTDPETGHKFIAGVIRDITEWKKADEERHELEEHLYQSEKMQAIGQLAGGIAHDFNNQLGIIIGYAEMLEDALGGDEESRRFLERILKAARRASELTRQLLAYARKGHYQNVTVNVHKIIEEVMGLLEHTMDKRISMASVLAADPPLVSGDPTQLQNAILNVALNARDAMPDGGQLKFTTANVVLDISYCEKQPYKVQPGRYLQIGVEDTGTGMTEEVRKRIFEPFFTTKEKSKGTGMGMAAVYGTVKGHKGSIEIVSAPQEGTLVMLFFPVAVAAEKNDEKPVSEPVGGRAARVLLVDDEDMVRTMTAELLRKLGHSPLLAKDGLEAVEIYKKQHNEIDLVLLDMIMPHLNGHDTLLRLQQTDPKVKVVLCSGYNMDINTRAAIRDGALMFLQKPLSRSALAQTITEVMSDDG